MSTDTAGASALFRRIRKSLQKWIISNKLDRLVVCVCTQQYDWTEKNVMHENSFSKVMFWDLICDNPLVF